jgi:superfamily II DNA/RNA helicase
LNWPQREKCNTRDCKAARPEDHLGDLGPAATVPADRQPARPAALVLAPTRELAQQISEVARLAGGLGVSVACLYGGVGKGPQAEALYVAGAGLVVGTPGRV